ncbi:hypothetical protein Q3V37_20580 [Micromonospora profundi]|uniref:Uncharacterized protein n=1 Tax=Micromonospora profundi TaxID=1420889 RepID=A0AAJ6HSG8_9ACTN|nr:hypothetical protein [Micromonospora profundi]WLS43795.1 hypothetical protein Q3V37_20580 [Micromonospora profundi]
MLDWVTVAKAILGPALKPVGGAVSAKLSESVFGPKEMHALEVACEKTLDDVLARSPALDTATPEMRIHLRELIKKALELIPDLTAVATGVEGRHGLEARLGNSIRSGRSSLDPESTPAVVLEIAGEFVAELPKAVRVDAVRPDSRLYRLVSLAEIGKVQEQVALLNDRWLGRVPKRGLTDDEINQTKALQGAGLTATLERLYPNYSQINLYGCAYPIAVIPARADQYSDLESALGPLIDTSVPAQGDYPAEFDNAGRVDFDRHRAEANSRKWNAPTFALSRIFEDDGQHFVESKMGRYFLNLATSDALDEEMMAALALDPDHPVGWDRLPRRKWLHDHVEDPVACGSLRSPALSVATAVVVRRDGGYSVLLSPRSGDVARHRFFNHVAPSGIFQPHNVGALPVIEEYSVRLNLLREYVEELYCVDEMEISKGLIDHVEGYPEVGRLQDLILEDRAGLFYTGLSANLLMLRIEICTMLYIDDMDWLKRESAAEPRRQMFGWEYTSALHEGRLPAGRRLIKLLHLDENLEPTDRGAELTPSSLVPNAAAALALALPALRTEISRRGPSA